MENTVIVVSGPPGAGTSTISQEIAKKLNFRYLSPGKTYKSFLDEKESKAALDFWQTDFGSSPKLHHNLDKEQIEEAKKGKIVICGKLSIHFLKKLSDCKVWLDVPIEIRAKRTAKRDKIPIEEALKEISKRENLERIKWKEIYGFDYFELKDQADLILKAGKLELNEAVEKIINYLNNQ